MNTDATPRFQGKGRAAFTLIELLIVVVIIGVLAAVAVLVFVKQNERAKAAEGWGALGAIRRAQAAYRMEHGAYVSVALGDIANLPHAANPGLGLDFSNNAFFGNACFGVYVEGDTFVAEAFGGAEGNDAHRAAEVSHLSVWINHKGEAAIENNGEYSGTGGGQPDWAPGPPPWVPANRKK